MDIQVGKIYMDKVIEQKIIFPNKTKKYLLPCLKEYGNIFINKLNNVFKVAVGIGDIIVDNCGYYHEKHIFILLDSIIANKFFLDFLDWIKKQSMYQDDYVFGNIQKSKYHMVVLKFPEKFYDSFETFKVGKYSSMFNKETIDSFFNNHPKTKLVFIKDHNYKVYFVDKVNEIYNLKGEHRVREEEWEGELDFPPKDKKEIFNHHLKKII